MQNITLYSDGACRGNNSKDMNKRIGGYGIVLISYEHKKKKEIKFATKATTNNIMELTAVIEGLKALKFPCNVDIITDSKYVTNAFNLHWFENWKKRGWRKGDGSVISNKELWIELDKLLQIHKCTFTWVKGHANNEWNNRCDELANIAMDELINKEGE